MSTSLRPATPDDMEKLLPLVQAYHEYEQLESTPAQREAGVRQLLENSAFGYIWLVHCDGQLAGYIALCFGYSIEFSGTDAFVDEFYLAPEFRGRGVGTQVLKLVNQQALELGVRAVHLEVARENQRARRLYEKAGFAAREKYVLMSVAIAQTALE